MGKTRSIPAWAGETPPCPRRPAPGRVYPRVGGGNLLHLAHPARAQGLSPRGRGKPAYPIWAFCSSRSIPAWAGETAGLPRADFPFPVYPRVGGGNGHALFYLPDTTGLSPRGRGKRRSSDGYRRWYRSIPAWAGETVSTGGLLTLATVYPRVGGGNLVNARFISSFHGLSPRGRGKPAILVGLWKSVRSIPAWAGETGTA